jgi:hypothetical protein
MKENIIKFKEQSGDLLRAFARDAVDVARDICELMSVQFIVSGRSLYTLLSSILNK